MWIITTRGFLSVVQNTDAHESHEALLVRASVRGDLDHFADFAARHGEGPVVASTPDADYGYRLTVSRGMFAAYLSEQVDALNYPNFKDEVGKKDPKRAHVYMGVWTALRKLREIRA